MDQQDCLHTLSNLSGMHMQGALWPDRPEFMERQTRRLISEFHAAHAVQVGNRGGIYMTS